MTKRQAAKVHFENETIAEAIKENASRIFAGFPKIKVKYGRDKDSRDNTPPPPEVPTREIPSRDSDSNPFGGEVYDGGIENNFKITRTVSPLVKPGSSSAVTFAGQSNTSIGQPTSSQSAFSKPQSSTEKISDKDQSYESTRSGVSLNLVIFEATGSPLNSVVLSF